MGILYRFGDFRLDPSRRSLTRLDQPVALAPKAFDVLLFLLENRDRALTKEELIERVWPGTFVEEGNLKFNVSVVRKALGDESWIATLPRHGYRFAGEVETCPAETLPEVVVQTRDRAEVQVSVEAELHSPSIRWRVAVLAVVLLSAAGYFWLRHPESAEVRSMAVLPLRSLSSAGDREMELGLTDSLIGRLGSEGNWLVRPTGAVARYAGTDRDPVTAGKALGVDAVLDGSIQRSGGQIRLTLQVLRVSDGKRLWTGKFDRNLTDLFAMEDQIANDVAKSLRLPSPRANPTRAGSQNPQVYELYLTGRHFFNEDKAPTRQAVRSFEQAIEQDPGFAPAHAMLALSYWQLSQRGVTPSRAVQDQIRSSARKAIELDDSAAEGHVAMAFTKMWLDFDWSGSQKEYRRALQLNPNEPLAYVAWAMDAIANGRFEEAEKADRKKLEIDPQSLMSTVAMGFLYMYQERYDEALTWTQKALQVDPNFVPAYQEMSGIYFLKGMPREGLNASLKSAMLSGTSPENIAERLHVFETQGLDAYRRNVLKDLLSRVRQGKYVSPMAIATQYNGLGDNPRALDWLEKACDERTFQILFLKTYPGWANLRGEPRFQDLLRKMLLIQP